MHVVYTSPPLLCQIVEQWGQSIMLQPVDGDDDSWFIIERSDPRLSINPSEEEVRACGPYDPDAKVEPPGRSTNLWSTSFANRG